MKYLRASFVAIRLFPVSYFKGWILLYNVYLDPFLTGHCMVYVHRNRSD